MYAHCKTDRGPPTFGDGIFPYFPQTSHFVRSSYEGGFDRPLPRLQANRVMLDFGLLRHLDRLDKTLSYKKSLYIATAGSREAHQYTCTPRVLDCRTVCWQLNTLGPWDDLFFCIVKHEKMFPCFSASSHVPIQDKLSHLKESASCAL